MKALRSLLCRFGIHLPAPGIEIRWSIRWTCAGCGAVKPGALALRRRR